MATLREAVGYPAHAIFTYYSSMFSASGMLAHEDKAIEKKDSFITICGMAGLTTIMAIAVSTKFFLPSYISIAYAGTVFLVPLVYRALGSIWVRFCNLVISKKCNVPEPKKLGEKSQNSTWRWFVVLQLVLVLSFWSATLFANGYTSESMSLLISFGCFTSLCVAVLVTHGVGGKLKYESYRFYQPFEGGTTFCILQAFGWALFSISLFFIVLHFLLTSANMLQFCGQCILKAHLGRSSILIGASSTGVVSEVLMALSLLVFHDEDLKKNTLRKIRRVLSSSTLAAKARETREGSGRVGRRTNMLDNWAIAGVDEFIPQSNSSYRSRRVRALDNWGFYC